MQWEGQASSLRAWAGPGAVAAAAWRLLGSARRATHDWLCRAAARQRPQQPGSSHPLAEREEHKVGQLGQPRLALLQAVRGGWRAAFSASRRMGGSSSSNACSCVSCAPASARQHTTSARLLTS